MQKIMVAIVMALALSACASSGRQITQDKIEQIQLGSTTIAQMNEVFGAPASQSYGSDGKLSMNWMYVYAGPFGTDMKQQILAVLFSEDGKVEKYNMLNSAPDGVRLGR